MIESYKAEKRENKNYQKKFIDDVDVRVDFSGRMLYDVIELAKANQIRNPT